MNTETVDISFMEQEFQKLIGNLREGVEALDQVKKLRLLQEEMEREQRRLQQDLNNFESRTQELKKLERRAKKLETELNASRIDIEKIIQEIPNQHKTVVEEKLFQPFERKVLQMIGELKGAINDHWKHLEALETEVGHRFEAMESRLISQVDNIQEEIAILKRESAQLLEQRINETHKQIINQRNQKLKWHLVGIFIVAIISLVGVMFSAINLFV